MKSRLLIFFLFLSIFNIYASDVKFYNINAMYGISMREMASVCKDGNGFIWASSKTGILRITESDYRIYQLPYKTANIINVKLAYNNSFLIAYTNNGQFFHYNELYDRFDLFLDLRISFNNTFLSVGKVVIDDEQALWIPTSGGRRHSTTRVETGHLFLLPFRLRPSVEVDGCSGQRIVFRPIIVL